MDLGVIRALGVDPGFANMGLAILEQRPGSRPRALLTRVSTTEKQSGKKSLVETRVTVDDQRRLTELWESLEAAITEHRPGLMGVEAYRPFSGRGGGNAWKSAVGYGMVSGFGRSQGWPVMVFLPDDLKRAFTLSRSSTKQEVEDALCLKIDGLRESLSLLRKTQREHAADAAGHAYLALVEQSKLMAQFSKMFNQGGLHVAAT